MRGAIAAAAALMLFAAGSAQAAVLDFDDVSVPPGSFGYQPLAPAYHGFTFTNWAIIDTSQYGASGYTNGVVSGTNVACGCANDWFPETIDSITSPTAFTFNSGWFTSAWYDGATLQVRGYSGATLLHSASFVLDTTGPTFLSPGWAGLDRLEFEISGGTHAILSGDGPYFGVDNLSLTAVPEPAEWALLLTGVAGLGAMLRRRRAGLAA
jgi:hypothetical protein